MLAALEAVVRELERRSVPHALIGATAMAALGIVRATDDVDLLVTDRAVLREDYWKDVAGEGFDVEVRLGDDEDRLAGVVRVLREPARALDLVVGRHAWQAEIIERAERHQLGSVEVGLALPSDLILLKLFAGARQDLMDAEALLELGDRRQLEAAVDAQIDRLPADAREAWRGLKASRGSTR